MGKEKIKWKVEYDYTYYKVYDNKGALAGYFFPHYSRDPSSPKDGDEDDNRNDEESIERLNKNHELVSQGTLLVPMTKLDLLDHEEGISVDHAIESLDANLVRTRFWKDWLTRNAKELSLYGASVHTAREDRNMLSLAIGISGDITLGEKEVKEFLTPLLDRLHEDGLL
ncbi:MAG TPA: hypothetical protein VHA09_05820 [Nitrososphaera sp.]|nr:hypothetical protein [Nitrososphaera sp.]